MTQVFSVQTTGTQVAEGQLFTVLPLLLWMPE